MGLTHVRVRFTIRVVMSCELSFGCVVNHEFDLAAVFLLNRSISRVLVDRSPDTADTCLLRDKWPF